MIYRLIIKKNVLCKTQIFQTSPTTSSLQLPQKALDTDTCFLMCSTDANADRLFKLGNRLEFFLLIVWIRRRYFGLRVKCRSHIRLDYRDDISTKRLSVLPKFVTFSGVVYFLLPIHTLYQDLCIQIRIFCCASP